MELIETLTKELGVEREQARGGVGILFQFVKEALGEEDFCKVIRLLPDLEEIVKAGTGDGRAEAWQEIALASPSGFRMRKLEDVAGEFVNLGLDCAMVNRFVPFMVSYVRQKGGDEINSLRDRKSVV